MHRALGMALIGCAWLSCQQQRPPLTTPPHVAEKAATPRPPAPALTYLPHPEADDAARAELDRIDAELVAHFDYETGDEVAFSASDRHLETWDWPSLEKKWRAALSAREGYAERIDRIIDAQPSPPLTVRALARRGSLADSMRRGLMTLEQRGFVVISPTLHAGIERVASLDDAGVGSVEQQEAMLRQGFEMWRQREGDALVERAIAAYAWAAVVARGYVVAFVDVRHRLETLRAEMGAKRFAEVVYRSAPPAGFAVQYERLVDNDLGLSVP